MKYYILSFFLLFSYSLSAQDRADDIAATKDTTSTIELDKLDFATLIEKSYDYIEADNLEAAEYCLREALRREPANPNNFALLTNLGTLQRRQGKLQEAVMSYTAALGQQPKSISILENRGSLYSEIGETEKAIQDYTSVLLLSPDYEDGLYSRGILFLQEKKFLQAEADFEKIIELNQGSVRGRMGYAVLEKLRGNYAESERIYNYLIERMPSEWQLYEARADLFFIMGRYGRALGDVNRVFAEVRTPRAEAYVLRGKIKLAQYERASALKDLEKARSMGYDSRVIDDLIRLSSANAE